MANRNLALLYRPADPGHTLLIDFFLRQHGRSREKESSTE